MSAALPIGSETPSRRRALLAIVAVLALGGLAYLAAYSWPLLFPRPFLTAGGAPGCDLHQGPCTAVFGDGGTIRLEMEPKTLPPTQPLRVLVDTTGLGADSLSVEFSGAQMNMGLIRADMLDTGDGSFAGDAILPVCVRQRMAWKAVVTATGPAGTHQATFDLEIYRP